MGTLSDRSLRGERRRSDGKATPLRSCRADLVPGLSCVWDVHASLWLCRSLLPFAFDLEKSSDVEGGALREHVARIQPQSWHWSRIGVGLLCVQNILSKSGIFGW